MNRGSQLRGIFTVQPVPEPSGQVLFLSGAAMLWLIRRRKLRTA